MRKLLLAASATIAAVAFQPKAQAATLDDVRAHGMGDDIGKPLGLDSKWSANVISAAGNYGESFERNAGQNSLLKLQRELNGLWTNGGLMNAIPCPLTSSVAVSYQRPNILTVRPLLVMAGEGLPSTSLSEPASRFVDGGTSPAMTVIGQNIGPLVSG